MTDYYKIKTMMILLWFSMAYYMILDHVSNFKTMVILCYCPIPVFCLNLPYYVDRQYCSCMKIILKDSVENKYGITKNEDRHDY